MATGQWAFVTCNRSSVQLADLSPHLSERKLSFRLNKPPTAVGKLSLDSPRADIDFGVEAGVHEMLAYRDHTVVPVKFRLTDADVNLTDITATLGLSWSGLETYMNELQIYGTLPLTITAAQSAFAWQLINDVQTNKAGANYGIIRGLVPATDPSKTKIYADRTDVLSGIEELASRNDGFDFGFDNSKAFNCYYPYRGSDNGLVFEYGKNMKSISYRVAAGPGTIASDVDVKGNTNIATQSNSDARTKYGRREALVRMPNSGDSIAVLQEFADAQQYVLKTPIFVPTIKIDPYHPDNPWGSYWLGDTIRVRAKWGNGKYVNVNNTYRIIAIDVTINDVGTESISLELASTMPMVINRAMLDVLKYLEQPNATTFVTNKTLIQRIAELEAQLSAS